MGWFNYECKKAIYVRSRIVTTYFTIPRGSLSTPDPENTYIRPTASV